MTAKHQATFEDHRGKIEDLIVHPFDSVTRITTRKGKVRGNHIHHQTTQWTYVISGKLRAVHQMGASLMEYEIGEGEVLEEPAGFAHAWQALEDTVCLVFTHGPRAGCAYESDTHRLDTPLLK